MGKVMLKKAEAEALEIAIKTAITHGVGKTDIIEWKVNDLFSGDEEPLNRLDLDTIIRALYVGYEVESGPEEKVLEYYQSLYTGREFSAEWHKAVAITKTLDLLNVQIQGINC